MSMRTQWLLLTALTAPAQLVAQISADTAAKIDQVFASFNRSDAPGCSVGIDRGGQSLFRRGYGMASLESGAPMTEFSVVESGSVAKQFTAGAINYLALQGKLSLDDPIRKYIPELPDYGSPVTIRMAVNHTSGIRDMWTLFSLAGVETGTHLYTMDRAMAMVFRQKELNFPPNSAYLYSNSGYLLLAEIVKRVSGKPLAQYSQEVFFKPLGMSHTQWRDDWNRVVPGRVTAYDRIGTDGGYQVDMPFMSVYGAGGLLTTVGDMLKWNEHLSNPTIGGQPWVDLMQQRGKLNDGKDIEYASGLIVSEYRNEAEVSHSGATGGYRTFLGRWPARKLSVAILCNVAHAATIALGHQVADVFIGAKSGTQAAGQSTGGNQARPSIPVSAAELGALAGTYYSPELDVAYWITPADTGLRVQFGERAPVTLRATEKDGFAGPMGLSLKFTRAKNGKPDGFVLGAGRVQNLRFTRR